ncbi:hypothetical protein SH1V18_41290 [Vallitalea longa]|uniref:Uncharacterized protein n=1 Tax=Vallitalea longa TaxID=2936439 RepID=A0A9W5YEL9_9FIRM|nr:hypothetical protein [Vallitalea longa]GKX31649.1 hypothetical protein SH1V18_41290 [Vallitalea longa]
MDNNSLTTMNKFDITNYINSIKEAINKITREQLLNNLSLTINEYKEKSRENYKDSLHLLEAIKPFINNQTIEDIDKISEVFNNVDAIRMLLNNFLVNSKKNDSEIIPEVKPKKIIDQQGDLVFEDNTIYEIDKECKPSITSQSLCKDKNPNQNVFALFLLMLGNK